MTKQDYKLITCCIQRARDVTEDVSADYIAGWIEGLDNAACELAAELAAENGRFDRERFLNACGVDST